MHDTLKAHREGVPLWFIPMLYVGVTVVCALVILRLENYAPHLNKVLAYPQKYLSLEKIFCASTA